LLLPSLDDGYEIVKVPESYRGESKKAYDQVGYDQTYQIP